MADPFVYEAIETVSLTSTQTSVTFSSLTTDYEHLEIHMTVRTDLNTTYGYDYVGVRFNPADVRAKRRNVNRAGNSQRQRDEGAGRSVRS